jgi:chromosome segregation ATPase
MEENSKVMNNQFNNMNLNLQNKENEIMNLKNKLNKSNSDYEYLNNKFQYVNKDNKNNSLNSNYFQNQINDLNNQNTLLQSENKKLNVHLNLTKEKYDELNIQFSDIYTKYNQLSKDKYFLEQQNTRFQIENENLLKEIERLKNEIKKFNQYKENYDNNSYKNNSDLIKLRGDLDNITSISNENIDLISNWIDNYLHNVYFNQNTNYPEINLYSNNNIKFDKIKESLFRSKKLIDKQIIDLNNQIKDLKKVILNCKDANFKINKNLEDIHKHLKEEIEDGKYFKLNKFSLDSDLFSEIEDMINQTFALLKRIKISNEDNCVDKLIDDNCILSNNNQELNEKVEQLYNENCILNEKIKEISEKENDTSSLEEDNKKLLKDNITLIKKVKELKKKIATLTSALSTQ